jgi:hypothetical protein
MSKFFRSLHRMLLEDETCGHVAGMWRLGNFKFRRDKLENRARVVKALKKCD